MRRVLAVVGVGGTALILWAGAASCGRANSASGDVVGATAPELFGPADLGPDFVDVTAYPRAQQENYQLFVAKCSVCHTLARPINSTIADAPTWTRYVSRMHVKTEARSGQPLLSSAEAKRVISFLVFDSKERKVKKAEAFQSLQAELVTRYERALKERDRLKSEGGRSQARESAPYVGDR